MKGIVVYKSKYGSTKNYAKWIADELGFDISDAKKVSLNDLLQYDAIVYGGGLYAEVINGVHLITKNIDALHGKKIAVFSTGITPLDCREYYDKYVIEKNFRNEKTRNIKVFNFMGKMIISELSFVHKTAIAGLKKLMSSKENPTSMEKMLIDLCDADGDFSDKDSIYELIDYIKEN